MNSKIIVLFCIAFSCYTFSLSSQTRIKMTKEGGVYTIPCEVNGLKLKFILDTGAGKVSISLSEVAFMLKNGYLDSKDIIKSGSSMVADGTIIENTQIILREIKVGDLSLTNVKAVVVHNASAPLLLGQSAIKQLGIIQLDGNELVILNSKSENQNKLNAKELLEDAEAYQDVERYDLAADCYRKAYAADPSVFDISDLMQFAYTLTNTGDKTEALLYYDRAAKKCRSDKQALIKKNGSKAWVELISEIYKRKAVIYRIEDQFNDAIATYRSTLSIYNEYNVTSGKDDIYKNLAEVYSSTRQYKTAIDMYGAAKQTRISSKYKGQDAARKLKEKKLKDSFLAEALYEMALCYEQLMDRDNYNKTMEEAAAFGHKEALFMIENRQINNENNSPVKVNETIKLGKISLNAITGKNWNYTKKEEKEYSYISAENEKAACSLTALEYKGPLTVFELTNTFMELLEKDYKISLKNRKRARSRFYTEGSIDFSYENGNNSEDGGRIIVFKEGIGTYLIYLRTNKYEYDALTELMQIFESIKVEKVLNKSRRRG